MFKLKINLFLSLSVMSIVCLAGTSNVSVAFDRQTFDKKPSPVTSEMSQSNHSMLAPLNSQGQRRYIVSFKEPAVANYQGTGQFAAIPRKLDNKIEVNSIAVSTYVNHLKQQQHIFLHDLSTQLGRPINSLLSYQYSINGMAVNLTAEEAFVLEQNIAVASVRADRLYALDTDAGPTLIGANNVWNGMAPSIGTALGADVVIGTLDTGINFDHPSFADVGDDAYDHTNPLGSGNYVGVCDINNIDQFIDTYICNDKLIGGFDFINALVPDDGSFDILGPEDENGHGSHTASISGGNIVLTAAVNGATDIAISGVAPHATLIHFDVCYNPANSSIGCAGAAAIAAVDQAIAGGIVDVINYSISGGNDPWNDDVSLAFLSATDSGIFISTSSGDFGPGSGTLGHLEPWTVSVGASTHDRVFENLMSITGPTIEPELIDIVYHNSNVPASASISAGILYAGTVNTTNFEGCDAFPANSFDGLVALIAAGSCSFSDKVANAAAAGAISVVIHNNVAGIIEIDVGEAETLPSFSVSQADGIAMANYIDANSGTTILIELPVPIFSGQADVVAEFSSRGPSTFEYNKPDLIAPGVNILAASNDDIVTPTSDDEYKIMSGTSMSSPHIAGSAALLKELHPTWSAAEIKSALMLTAVTAGVTKEDGMTPADPFDRGAGRIQVDVASSTGLVMNESASNFLAADPLNGGDPKTLNVASYKNDQCIGTCSFQREFTSVAVEPVEYTARLVDMTGTVNPDSFTAMPGETITLNIEIDGDALDPGALSFGELRILSQGPSIDFSLTTSLPITDGGYQTNDPIENMNCSTIAVSGVLQPVTVSIELGIDHTWVSDLTLKLFNPNGDELAFLNQPGFPADFFGNNADLVNTSPITFSDTGITDAEDLGFGLDNSEVICESNELCDYFGNPDQELLSVANFAALNAADPNGDWLLCGGDSVTPDPGTIESATLLFLQEAEVPSMSLPLIVTGFPGSPDISVTPTSLTATLDADMSVDLNISISNSDAVVLPLNWLIDNTSTSNLVDETYYEQFQTGTFAGIISDLFVDGITDPGVYSADSFELTTETDIDGFAFDGFLSISGQLPDDDITAFTVKVYANEDGLPAGHPEDGANNELFSATIPDGDYNLEYVTTAVGQSNIRMNVKNFSGESWTLAAGTYWVMVYAHTIGPNSWGWFTGVPGDDLLPHIIDPQDFFEDGLTSWTDLITATSGNADYSGLAFKARSLIDCGASWITYSSISDTLAPGAAEDVVVTLDSTGLTAGVYEGAVCVASDDANESLIALPVTLTVEGSSDFIFVNGFDGNL